MSPCQWRQCHSHRALRYFLLVVLGINITMTIIMLHDLTSEVKDVPQDHNWWSHHRKWDLLNMDEDVKTTPPLLRNDYHNYDRDCTGPRAMESLTDTFQQINRDIYLYSAYWDMRQNDFDNVEGGAVVRMIGVMTRGLARHPRGANLSCVFTTDSGQVITTPVMYYEMTEHHENYYAATIASCHAPRVIKTRPCAITVVFNSGHSSFPPKAVLPLHSTEVQPQRLNFGICIPAIFGHVDHDSLIEFMELSQLLGVERVVLYDLSVPDSITDVLQYYTDKGFVEVVQFPLPHGLQDKIWYHGQMLAIQDCLYRHMGAVRYVAFQDLDEVIVPKATRDWAAMLARLDNDTVAGFPFQSAYFDPAQQSDLLTTEADKSLYTLYNVVRGATFSAMRKKCIVHPERIFEMGIHHVSKPIMEWYSVREVSPDTAFIHHYQTCFSDFYCEQLVTDHTIPRRFKDQLTYRVHQTIKILSIT